MKRYKKILPIIIGIIIGISMTVGAATIFNSKDITYSSDKTTKTNVKDSLDELYMKVDKCHESFADMVKIGDWIKMTPTKTSYTISLNLTGYTSDQTINPSELNIWRVISKNNDGTVDVLSVYGSSTSVYFSGGTGYINFVGTLNIIASQYTNSKYVLKTRAVGYNDQEEFCSLISQTSCVSDFGFSADIDMIKNVPGAIKNPGLSGGRQIYWIASRGVGLTYQGRLVKANGEIEYHDLIHPSGEVSTYGEPVRPILTLRRDISIDSGKGTNTDPYILK